MGKNVAVFVDVANIFYAAKAAGVDIDYVTLLKSAGAGRDLVRAYAYTGLDPDNENQRNFHDFLRRHGYRVVSKDIRKYGDGKVKANLDIELVVDMLKTARNLDVAIVVSGDGDFAPAIRAVQEMGVRVEVVSFRGNTSSDLMDVADQFTDITQIAKVEKGSSRSGRRVATDDEDLSMTEVPEKQSEGTGERGRGRGRSRRTEAGVGRVSRSAAAGAARASAEGLTILPGEKLSRAAAAAAAVQPGAENGEEPDVEAADQVPAAEPGAELEGDELAPRRRRRRGGRGRGRRGRDQLQPAGERDVPVDDADLVDEEAPDLPPARRPASTFGSVWDSQIGMPAGASPGPAGSVDASRFDEDEDLEEPAVPEYLLAERRRRESGRGGRGRGRGGAYAAAMERERFGGGRGQAVSRFAEPAGRGREGGGGRADRPPFRQPHGPRPAPRPSSDEPWSEVPPEIEAMLRAQLASRPAPRAAEPAPEARVVDAGAAAAVAPSRSRARRAAKPERAATPAASAEEAPVAASEPAEGATKPARRRAAAKPAARRSTTAKPATDAAIGEAPGAAAEATEAAPTRRARSPRTARAGKAAATTAGVAADAAGAAVAEPAPEAAPKRRTIRKKAEPSA